MKKEYQLVGDFTDKQKEYILDVIKSTENRLLLYFEGARDHFSFNENSHYQPYDEEHAIVPGIDNNELTHINHVLNLPNIVFNALSRYGEYINIADRAQEILDSDYAKNLPVKDRNNKDISLKTADDVVKHYIEETSQRWYCYDDHVKELKNNAFSEIIDLSRKAKEQPVISLREYDIDNNLSKDVQNNIYEACDEMAKDHDSGFDPYEICDSWTPDATDDLFKAADDISSSVNEIIAEGARFNDLEDYFREGYTKFLNDEVYRNEDIIYFNRFAHALNTGLEPDEKDRLNQAFSKSGENLEDYIDEFVSSHGNSYSSDDFLEEIKEHVSEILNENSNELVNSDDNSKSL